MAQPERSKRQKIVRALHGELRRACGASCRDAEKLNSRVRPGKAFDFHGRVFVRAAAAASGVPEIVFALGHELRAWPPRFDRR